MTLNAAAALDSGSVSAMLASVGFGMHTGGKGNEFCQPHYAGRDRCNGRTSSLLALAGHLSGRWQKLN